MKIEMKPITNQKKPRYAAALALLASTVLMTGCSISEQSAFTVGIAPQPNVSEDDLLRLEGETQLNPDPVQLEGEAQPVENPPVALGGDVYIEPNPVDSDDDLRIDGVMDIRTDPNPSPDPDPDSVPDPDPPVVLKGEAPVELAGEEPIYQAPEPEEILCSNCGIDFTYTGDNTAILEAHQQDVLRVFEAAKQLTNESRYELGLPSVRIAGVEFPIAAGCLRKETLLFLVDSNASDGKRTQGEWLEALTKEDNLVRCDWGYAMLGKYQGMSTILALIDVSLYEEMTPEYAQTIAEDLFT
jgi:hypothetical protein